MANSDPRVVRLKELILHDQVVHAEALAKELGSASGAILLELASHDDPDVRLATLEVAATLQGPDICRLATRMLSDEEFEISELAITQIGKCSGAESVSDLLAAMERNEEPKIRAALALQVGRVGSAGEQSPLDAYRREAKDPGLEHALNIAIARLGEGDAKREVVERLMSMDLDTRVQALKDVEYIGDAGFVSQFGDVLSDTRDVVPLSTPDNPPIIFARVCDIAVLTMLRLGVKLSYEFDMLTRLEERHLEEARRYVAKLAGG